MSSSRRRMARGRTRPKRPARRPRRPPSTVQKKDPPCLEAGHCDASKHSPGRAGHSFDASKHTSVSAGTSFDAPKHMAVNAGTSFDASKHATGRNSTHAPNPEARARHGCHCALQNGETTKGCHGFRQRSGEAASMPRSDHGAGARLRPMPPGREKSAVRRGRVARPSVAAMKQTIESIRPGRRHRDAPS